MEAALGAHLAEFKNRLPLLVVKRLNLNQEYCFDAFGQETVENARALLADPAKIDRMCEGFSSEIRQVLEDKLRKLIKAGGAMAGGAPAPEAAQKQFVTVAADPFSGKALDESAAHTGILCQLSEKEKMLVTFMRVRDCLSELGDSLDAQVRAIHNALRMGVRNNIIDQAEVELWEVQKDPISMEILRQSLFVRAPGIRGAARHFDSVIMSEEVSEGTRNLLSSLFDVNELRHFDTVLTGGDAIEVVSPEAKVTLEEIKEIVKVLPKGQVTRAELSEAFVGLLAHRGILRDPAFWDMLKRARPERYRDVAPYREFILGK